MDLISRFVRGNPAGCAALSLLFILIGYADLWRGGTEIAAAFLVFGYVLLAPVAILAYGGTAPVVQDEGEEAPPYRAAGLVGLAVWLLYVLTLAPTTAMWDTSEYIAAARVLGIPHPPGNPLFVLIAHAFAMIPVPVSYAARVNLLAATTSAISAALWFLVAFRSLRGWNMPRVMRIVAAAAAAWIGATAFSVWNQSVVNEKVYTVAMLGVAAVAWAALRWNDAPDGSRKADAMLLLIAFLCGLGYTNHPAGFLPLPAFALYVLIRRPRTIMRWKLLSVAAALVVLGLTPFAFQPIRAAHHPEINVGTPTACEGKPEFGCTFSGETWRRLMSNVSREQYGGHSYTDRKAPFTAQVGMWWLYFKWQWMRDAFNERGALQNMLAMLFLALGITGGVMHYRRDRSSFWFVGPLIFTLTPALIFYLNFKYGWSQSPELSGVDREVRDRDYFYLWSFATWGIWAGLGLTAVWQFAARLMAGSASGGEPETAAASTATSDSRTAAARARARMTPRIPQRAYLLAIPVLLVALIPLIGNSTQAPRRGQTFTADWARDLLQSVEPYGILITNGDNDSFPVWYAQYVEGVRRDVTVVLVPYLRSEWYARELLQAELHEYDGSGLPEYAALAKARPTRPLFDLTPEEADQVPPGMQLDRPARFEHAGVVGNVPAGVVFRDQLLVLQLIKDNFPERPIYFSLGDYPRVLGLDEYVITQGFVQRLVSSPPALDSARYTPVRGAYIDIDRTAKLLAFYNGKDSLARQGGWIDDASILIPTAYALVGQSLAQALDMRGLETQADSVMRETVTMARAARLMPQ